MELKIKRLDKELPLPEFIHENDVALDLRSSEDVELKPSEKKLISTGIAMAIPPGNAGLVWDRSGMAAKYSLHTMAGVIDSSYRGEIKVVMINLGKETFFIEKGMRIAQILIQPITKCKVTEAQDLDKTSRGDDGFGSTGLK